MDVNGGQGDPVYPGVSCLNSHPFNPKIIIVIVDLK